MTVSLSFTLVTTYAPQSAPPATVAERSTPPVQDDGAGCANKRPASRPNRLADAMLSALRGLGFGGAPAAPATPPAAPAATEAASATDSSARVESAVQQFAHALFQALRQSGRESGKADDADERVAGHRHHRHHHHRRHGEGPGYGDMSQRLEALSQTVGNTTDAAATTPAKNPLLDAFTTLFNSLKPATTGAAATTPANDMTEKLRQFLHTLAQALAPDTMGSVLRAQVGGLVNVSA